MIAVTVSPDSFDAGALLAMLQSEGVGAVASFIGVVRGDDGLSALTLEHYPGMTEAALRAIAEAAQVRWALRGVVVHHRVGRLVAGAPIVFVGTASAHRHAALEACTYVIDRLKTDAPFWKHECFTDGRESWVEAPAGDETAAARWD